MFYFITTLFNLFCPLIVSNINRSIILICIFRLVLALLLFRSLEVVSTNSFLVGLCKSIFPLRRVSVTLMIRGFIILAWLNLVSLVCYSFPVTTTLRFNLRLALILWLSRVLFILFKLAVGGVILPSNSPWYLASFLSLVELISIVVRPVTLCFRLLANIRAGHVLLTLICKMTYGLWILGVIFGLLELIVAFVQAFVFLILTTVYIEEAFSH